MDRFFDVKNCDRCGGGLKIRTQSWFTDDVICMKCSDEESKLKKVLREKYGKSFEGCGYIPKEE